MKSNLLLASLVAVCATGSLMSMEKNTARLNFLCKHNCCIKGYSAENMGFDMPPEAFIGKNIIDVVSLNKHDKDAVQKGFDDAFNGNKTVKVPYHLKGEAFIATITPFVKANKKNNFFVKIQDFDDNGEVPELR